MILVPPGVPKDVLTRNDHTPSLRAPYAKLGLHLIQTKACQQTKSFEYEASLISLKELAEKKKDGEVTDEKVNCK